MALTQVPSNYDLKQAISALPESSTMMLDISNGTVSKSVDNFIKSFQREDSLKCCIRDWSQLFSTRVKW